MRAFFSSSTSGSTSRFWYSASSSFFCSSSISSFSFRCWSSSCCPSAVRQSFWSRCTSSPISRPRDSSSAQRCSSRAFSCSQLCSFFSASALALLAAASFPCSSPNRAVSCFCSASSVPVWLSRLASRAFSSSRSISCRRASFCSIAATCSCTRTHSALAVLACSSSRSVWVFFRSSWASFSSSPAKWASSSSTVCRSSMARSSFARLRCSSSLRPV